MFAITELHIHTHTHGVTRDGIFIKRRRSSRSKKSTPARSIIEPRIVRESRTLVRGAGERWRDYTSASSNILRVFLLQMRLRPAPTDADITSAFFRTTKVGDKPS